MRRSTVHISLVIAGIMAIAGCSDEKRHVYRSRQDCMEDWGGEKDCEEPPAGSPHYAREK